MRNKKFETILLKNTVAVTLPAIVVFLLLIYMFMRYSVFEQIKCVNIGNIENLPARLEELEAAGTTNVKYDAQNLYYTGFDYYINGKQEGAYYYSMDESRMVLFLLKTDEPKLHIDSVTIKGKIIRDAVSTEHIVNRLSESAGLTFEWLEEYCSSYVISEPDYPYAYNTMVYVLFCAPVVICILIFVYTLLVWINPLLHPQVRQLAVYGEPGAIIEELNLQLRKKLLFKKRNIYITEDYMIVSYMTKTDVIRLDNIKYLSKNLVENEGGLRRRENVYRLTMSNPDKMFYEVDFTSEALIDDVVRYIRGMNEV